ncbi:MAG: TonB-dependent receptor [Bryobacterales bacterium]|nr:TonB-dependent receptor [Bryobacterales bacterium]MBV9398272.1 TonB-dependent receptor [Bryobacterales bacterium]
MKTKRDGFFPGRARKPARPGKRPRASLARQTRAGSCLLKILSVLLSVYLGFSVFSLSAAERHGQVKFGGLPVPGATVTATQGDKKIVAVSDADGNYSFSDLADGAWTIQVEMLGFAPVKQEVNIAADAAIPDAELRMLPLNEIHAEVAAAAPPAPKVDVAPPQAASAKPATKNAKGKQAVQPTNTQTAFQRTDVNATAQTQGPPPSDAAPPDPEVTQRASDGLLINGTANNGASSPFALNQAFGNGRRGPRSLYNGNLGFIIDNSVTDARNFSLTGQDTPKPSYNRWTAAGSFGGPIKIPHLLRNGPFFTVSYQLTRNRNASTVPGLMPTSALLNGDFSPLSTPVFDPTTGQQFPNNIIPASRFSPEALALLKYYPQPNFTGRYNYQIPIISVTHQDSMQARAQKQIGRKDNLSGGFAFQNTNLNNPNLFGFLDTTHTLGLNANTNWRHNFTPRLFANFGFQFSRQSVHLTPYFENRVNVSGAAGVNGNNQEPVNWGPPSLSFSSGISGLSDGLPQFDRNMTNAVHNDYLWNHGRHNVQFGADYQRQRFNILSQQNPRGGFGFTGAATQQIVNGVPVPGTGSDFADFLLGIPDTSSLAFGNADKYFRASNYDAFVTDDWRVSPGLTLNIGARWEYWSPITELHGRLVNLDIAPGFTAVAPVVANRPVGPLTGQTYSDSLVHPDKHAIQPRVGISWRPISGSSIIIRAGYGVYYNTSVYQVIATQMAQQSPLSTSLSVANTPDHPLSLANGFIANPNVTTNTFAIDPNFRVGYAQNWQLSVQRDLPAGLQMVATYLGIKGTRAVQEFLPNTYPVGAVNPCAACPSGFIYMSSNGNSTREAGSFQLRRRLRSGFTATALYTYSKSIDDAALGGQGQGRAVIAQDWLNLDAERGLSNFDQRHLLNLQAQYTSGLGLGGGTLLGGWKGALLKEWTVTSQIIVGTGLPLSPVYPSAVVGTGVTGPVRPNYTGAPLYEAPAGLALNPAAYVAPAPGQWGNAGRNSITGPNQFSWNASLGRTFRASDRISLDLRVDAVNVLNHVTFTAWNTTVNNVQFGLPVGANAMRSLQTTLRMRF